MPDLTVEADIAADPHTLWTMVADVTRMGEWSPETTACEWTGDVSGPAVGATFTGANRRADKAWSTSCRVTDCVPGEVFAFEVRGGPFKVARWEYRFEPVADGTRVTESWTDQRGRLIAFLGKFASGVSDRVEHNRAGMRQTLEALEAAAT